MVLTLLCGEAVNKQVNMTGGAMEEKSRIRWPGNASREEGLLYRMGKSAKTFLTR